MVGTAVAGRGRVELEPLIGLFAENLVLRLDLGGDPGFDRLVARARETTLAAWAHQDVPFERLVRELRPERDLSHSPLYQTALTLDASDRPPLELPGLRLELLPVESGTAKLDLALYLEDRQGGISGLLEYNRDLFDAATAVRLLAAFERLVEAVVRRPRSSRLSELPVLSEAERHQVLRELPGGDVAPETLGLVPSSSKRWAAGDPGGAGGVRRTAGRSPTASSTARRTGWPGGCASWGWTGGPGGRLPAPRAGADRGPAGDLEGGRRLRAPRSHAPRGAAGVDRRGFAGGGGAGWRGQGPLTDLQGSRSCPGGSG